MRALAAASVLVGVICFGAAIHPAISAMSVIDSSNLAKNAQIATTTTQILSSNEVSQSLLKEVLDTLGVKQGFTEVNNLGGILKISQSVSNGNLLGAVNGIQDVAPDFAPLLKAAKIAGRTISGGSPKSAADATKAIRAAFRVYHVLEPYQRAELQTAARQNHRLSVDEAYGAATYNLQSVSQSYDRVQTLADQSQDAETLNQRVSVMTASNLVLIEEIAQLRALLAADLKARSAEHYAESAIAIAADPDAPPPQIDAEGQPSGKSVNVFE